MKIPDLDMLTSSEDCFACTDPCCRFSPHYPSFFPVFTDEEYEAALALGFSEGLFKRESENTHRVTFKIMENGHYICPFTDGVKCRVYEVGPFWCRLWPFFVMKKDGKAYLTLDSLEYCPSLEKRTKEEILEHAERLREQLTTSEARDFFGEYPNLILPLDQSHKIMVELDLGVG
ncbi:MAG: hypothetical protein GF416_04695 [Candidatus Altiarchaeales archaeon]|nr:hypothetical protein [Candidatus Altiarchaeales archaeon]MBD3416419.1 hypothetical protein [Candidatus Altiarchaeales archaeon]